MKTQAENLHYKIYKLRVIILIILLGLSFSLAFAKKNELNFGLEGKLNFANQITHNPLNMEYESYRWDKLTCLGVNAFAEIQKGRHWSFTGKAGYNQKGFIQQEQTSFKVKGIGQNEAPVISDAANKNVFHYASFAAMSKYRMGKKLVVPFVQAGLQVSYLINKNLGSADFFALKGNQFYDYKYYQKMTAGLVAGIGATFDNKISLAFETDLDLFNSVNTSNLAVKNLVYSLTLGFSMDEIFNLY